MGTGATSLGDDGCDLGGGAAGLFALERHRQLQHVQVDAGPADPGVGQQRVEPADPPPTDPTVQGVAADPHPLTGRAEVVTLGQGTDQHAALAGAQRRVGGLPDQRIAKQRDGLAAVICWRHGGSLPVGRPSAVGGGSPASLPGYHGDGKGALVLHNSRPPLAPEANWNGPVCAPSRRAAATAATPIASTAHASGDPRGSGAATLGSSQPRTVVAGTSSSTAIGR